MNTARISLMVLIFAACPARASVSFTGPTDYPVGTNPVAVAIGDFNGDGKVDLVVVNSVSNDVSILLGNGDRTLQQAKALNPASGIAGEKCQ